MKDLLILLASLLGSVLAIIIYIIPSYLAFKNKHPNKYIITLINILLGWTLLGYLISLIWAVYGSNRNKITRKHIN